MKMIMGLFVLALGVLVPGAPASASTDTSTTESTPCDDITYEYDYNDCLAQYHGQCEENGGVFDPAVLGYCAPATTATTAPEATTSTTAAGSVSPDDDLDCGDPGTSTNMSVPADDPHRLDADNDGVGCESDNVELASSDRDSLPRTGSTTGPLVAGAAGLVAIGIAVLLGKRALAAR